jgi:hypothetical protein
MTFAFLFLTYTNPNDKFKNTINMYIHPKYPNQVNNFFKPFIINKLVNTEWGTYSIVQATLNLLEEAYITENNKWFILLSEDSYPLHKKIKIKENKSIFNLLNKNNEYWKTSQWWILKREDVKIILDNQNKYYNKFQNKIKDGAIDEYYFLSVLKWNNPNYEFTNRKIMYDKWLKNTIQKNPQYFNHLLDNDVIDIKKNNSLFVRKILPGFSLKKYKTKNKLYVIFIGTETNQDNIVFNDKFDIILIISIKFDLIKKEIIQKAIYIINIIYKFYFESILAICNEDYIKNWNIIIFTTEKFNLNSYNSIDKVQKALPVNLITDKKFYYIKDNNNNLAFCYKNIKSK